MYQDSYREVLDNASQTVRSNERSAILHSIRLLEQAESAGPDSREAVDAILFLKRLWEFFLVHLASEESRLPDQLRADLISVGLSILREAERVREGEVREFGALKDISQIIADGLI
jgi:flagellar biosynthesis activator protein FlaF